MKTAVLLCALLGVAWQLVAGYNVDRIDDELELLRKNLEERSESSHKPGPKPYGDYDVVEGGWQGPAIGPSNYQESPTIDEAAFQDVIPDQFDSQPEDEQTREFADEFQAREMQPYDDGVQPDSYLWSDQNQLSPAAADDEPWDQTDSSEDALEARDLAPEGPGLEGPELFQDVEQKIQEREDDDDDDDVLLTPDVDDSFVSPLQTRDLEKDKDKGKGRNKDRDDKDNDPARKQALKKLSAEQVSTAKRFELTLDLGIIGKLKIHGVSVTVKSTGNSYFIRRLPWKVYRHGHFHWATSIINADRMNKNWVLTQTKAVEQSTVGSYLRAARHSKTTDDAANKMMALP